MKKKKSWMQGVIDNFYRGFTGVVAQGRKLKIEEVRRLADGRIFTAPIDDLGKHADSKIRQTEAEHQRRVYTIEKGKLDYQKAVEEGIRAEQRRIEQERQRQAQEALELQRQIEQYNKKTFGLTPVPPHRHNEFDINR